jgi:hypothetical protein
MPDEQTQTAQPEPQAAPEEPTKLVDEMKRGLQEYRKQEDAKAAEQQKAETKPETPPAKEGEGQTPSAEAEQGTKLTRTQRDKAKQLGYSDEEIKSLTEPEIKAIERGARAMSRAASSRGRELQELRNQLEQRGKGADAPTEKDEKTETAGGPTTVDSLPQDFTFSPDVFGDEGTVAALNTLLGTVRRLETEISGIRSSAEAEEEEKLGQQVHDFFSELDADIYGERFGAGDVEEGTPEDEHRLELVSTAMALAEARNLDFGEALSRALAACCPDELRQEAAREHQRLVAERNKAITPPPSGATPMEKPMTDDDREREWYKFARERGIVK